MIRLFFKLPFCARRAFFIAIRLSHFAHIPHKSSIKILLPLLTFLPIPQIAYFSAEKAMETAHFGRGMRLLRAYKGAVKKLLLFFHSPY